MPTNVIMPALGVALILGNLYYTFLARRLARRENRDDCRLALVGRLFLGRPGARPTKDESKYNPPRDSSANRAPYGRLNAR